MRRIRPSTRHVTAIITVMVALVGPGAMPAAASEGVGAVFTMSNAAGGNQVVVFAPAGNGTLSHVADYATGGEGSGGGLGSQGSVRLSDDGSWLLVVNAGSDELSVFRVNGTTLELADTDGSGGDSPISIDIDGRIVYVLNAGSTNIAGFRLNREGNLTPIPGAVRPLSTPGADPAQIEFSPDGRTLVVTEKNTNRILAYRVAPSGVASHARVSDSAGETPFGFEFDPAGPANCVRGIRWRSRCQCRVLVRPRCQPQGSADRRSGGHHRDGCPLDCGDRQRTICLHHQHR